MSEQDILTDVRTELARTVTKGYRTTFADALPLADEILAGSPALLGAIEQAPDAYAVMRRRVYKDAVRDAKRLAYQRLRVYKTDAEKLDELTKALGNLPSGSPPADLRSITRQIASLHVSTRERLPFLAEFNEHMTDVLDGSVTILDVGCGVYPLLFPFTAVPSVEHYVAADPDAASIGALREYSKHTPGLMPCEWNLRDDWDAIPNARSAELFDVALLFKIVPVVARQKRELLSVLARTPARNWIVTGSTVSMTKRRSIARRERGTLLSFIAEAGRTVTSERIIGEELIFSVSNQ